MREKTARGGGKKTHFSFTSFLTITGFCWSAGYADAYAVAVQLAQLPAAADHYLAGRFAPALPLVAAGAGSARQNGAEPRSNLPPRRGGAGPGRTTALSRGGGREKEFVSWRHACHGSKRVPRRVGRQFLRAHGAVGERRRLSGRAPLFWFSPPPGPPHTWRSGAAGRGRGRPGWREMRRAGW